LLVSDPAVLADRVAHARAVIAGRAGLAPAEVADRVAASIVFLGLASRLVSPSLGAAQLTARMLALEPLRGTGELVQPDPSRPWRFLVRRSCCLFYRVPGGGTCGDCVLTPEDVRRQQWQAAR
jgi:FhuF 2Fe-2S C-terminal domain